MNNVSLKTHISRLTLVIAGCLWSMGSSAADLKTYQPGDWKPLIESRANQPMIVHFWGFTCSPCLEELPRWGEFVKQFPKLKTVFIEVDQIPPEITIQTLNDANLTQADNRSSATVFDEYMRYEIDQRWRGELPFTLLVSPKGEVKRLRGTADFKVIKQWLEKF